MKKNIYIISIILSFSQISYSQSYPLVTIEDIQYLPDSVLINSGDQQSPLNGDTVRVQGVVMIRPVVDAQTDRRQILRAGDFWMIYIVDPDGEQYEFFDGINPIQVDTMGVNQNTLFDLVDTADVVEFTVVIDEFFTTTQAVLLLNPVTPVSIVGNLGTRPSPIEVDISEFVDEQGNWNPLSEKYEGQYVIVRNAISSDADLSNGTFRLNDGQGNSILMYDQSGFFTLRSHRLTGLTDYEPPVDSANINYVRGFIQTHSELGIRIVPAYPGDISVSGIFGDSIRVLIPNGGEEWEAGTTQQINWFSSSVDKIRIEYSTDSGVNWQTIIEQLPNNNFYDWVIPNTASVNCKVRISNQFNPFVSDISDNVFIILPSPIPIINIFTPNGGEDWVIGTTQQILWASENILNVMIEYTADNGASWEIIVNSTQAQTGLYEWIVPETISTQCIVLITDVSDSSIFDVSDGTFTISSHKFTFEAQNTFLSDTVGSEMIFEINVQNLSSEELTLYFKRTINDLPTNWISNLAFGGLLFAPFIDSVTTTPFYLSSPLAPGESREWAVHVFALQNPGVANIRVVAGDFNNPGDSLSIDLVAAVSDTFLVLYIPNGGENWQVGTNQSIVWNSSNVGLINIDYTTDNGSSWLNINNDYDASLGSYSWTIPNTPSTQCKVKITDAANSNISDQSNSVFTIDSLPEPELSLIYPNGGEQFAPNDLVYIQWQHSLINAINLDFSDDNGATWSDIIMGFPADSNLYIWIIQPGISSAQCLIKICDFENPQFCDESDSVFTVTPPSSITVLIPNGGEVWPWGSTQDITWSSINVTDVKIERSLNNGASWSTIKDSTLSNGIYSWLVNPPQPSTQALIKISDVSDETIVDQSDDVFTIDIAPGVEAEFTGIPDSYKLLQNYPNPFNPSTTIYYGLPEESSLKITIYDVLGNEVMIYSQEKKEAGYHRMKFNATELPSGVYFYRLKAGGFVKTKKMVFMK